MHKLCDELRDKSKAVVTTLRGAGLREVDFKDLIDEHAAFPHIAATRSTVARVDHWVHSVIGATPHGEYEFARPYSELMAANAKAVASTATCPTKLMR